MPRYYSAEGLTGFLNSSPSCFHAVENIKSMLSENGFVEIDFDTDLRLEPFGKYFIAKNSSSLIAFTMPEKPPHGFLITASHSDSPSFRIKDNAEVVSGAYTRINVEPYGGMICRTWLDIPLSAAGRIMYNDNGNVRTALVNINEDSMLIPSMAIHMQPKVNDGIALKANSDMLPLFTMNMPSGSFRWLIAKCAGIDEKSILGTDLYLYNRMPARTWGHNSEFISSGKLDDLQCAYASLCGFLETSDMPSPHSKVYMICDNEEIGSQTKQGAGSTFLFDTLNTITEAYGVSRTGYSALLRNSFMLSCDNAHALHPNHPEMSDASHCPVINGGVVIKYGVRYATDGISEALFKQVCEHANVPYQTYSNRSDMPGGSTLGNISNTQVALNTADIGLAQLAMHSAFETAGAFDTEHLMHAIASFCKMELTYLGSGAYDISWK